MRYLLTLLICLPLSAATYYVATTGNDSPSGGTELNPWQTISYAAAIVSADDTVNVAAGTYAEAVNITRSGLSGQPITWIGERSGDDWLTIIDRSEALTTTGWTQATGSFTGGDRAYKLTLTTKPGLITMGGKSMLEMRWSSSSQSRGWWNLNKLGYSTTQAWGEGFGTKHYWDGFESMWAWTNNILYMRFRDSSSPATKTLRWSRSTFGVNVTASFNTFRDLHIRGGLYGMQWGNDLNGVVVERCRIDQGHQGIWSTGNTRNCIVRSNVFAGEHLGERPYGPRSSTYADHNIEYQMYLRNKYEWGRSEGGGAMYWVNPGINNLIHDNTITNIAVGFAMQQGNNRPNQARDASGTLVLRNTFQDTLLGVYVGAGHGDLTVASNSFWRCDYGLRFQNMNIVPAQNDPYLIYGNTIASTNLIGNGVELHAWGDLSLIGSPSEVASGRQEVWFYHNSFSGIGKGFVVSDFLSERGGMPNLYTINNLFSVGSSTQTSAGRWAYAALRGSGFWTPMFRSGEWAALDYNTWVQRSGHTLTIAEEGPNNVTLPDYEWPITSEPDFEIADDSGGRAAGVDVSAAFTVNSVAHAALPGYSPGYYESDIGPDIGAWQYSPGATVPLVSVTATDSLAHESTLATGTFTLTRTESLTGTLTVDYTITGTATAGTDYVDDLGTSITFADGDGSTNLVVTPLGNGSYYGNQTVILTLAADAAYLLRQPISATITIIEGDPQPGSLTRPSPPGQSPATRNMRL